MPAYIVLDSQDPPPLADFYCQMQDVEVLLSYDDGRYTALGPNREGLMVVLQRVPEAKVGKNRAHFDIVVDDLEGPPHRSSSSAEAGSNRLPRTSSWVSPGGRWPTRRATSS